MVINRWLTNLESRESLEAERDKAQAQVDASPASLTARAELNAALSRLVSHDRTMALIEQENGRIGIGEPMGTEYRTAEQIKADGHIGIYRT
jgi:hypothetical protein